jgi:hypothetical protein
MAITDRSLFNNQELDYMMPDAAPPGAALGPTGAGDPILDLLTPTTPNLGGGITTGGVPSFQTDVMNYNPETWKNFLRQLIKENPGRFQEIYLGKSNLPVHMQGPLEEVANENRSVAGQAVAKIPSIPGIQVPGSLVGDFISSPIDTTVGVGRAAKRRGGEVLDDIGAMLERIKAGTTLPAEEGREAIADIKAREAAEVTPTMALEETLTDIASGEVEGLPEEESIKKRMKENIVEGAEGVVLGSEAAGGKVKEIMKPWFKGRDGGGQLFPRLSRWTIEAQSGEKSQQIVGEEDANTAITISRSSDPTHGSTSEEAVIAQNETTSQGVDPHIAGDGNTNPDLNLTLDQLEKRGDSLDEEAINITNSAQKIITNQDASLTGGTPGAAGSIEELIAAATTDGFSGALSATVYDPNLQAMANQIVDFMTSGNKVDGVTAWYDLIDGIAAGLATNPTNPGVGIAKGAAAGSKRFNDRLEKEQANRFEAVKLAQKYQADLMDYEAALASALGKGVDYTKIGKQLDIRNDYLDNLKEASAGRNSIDMIDGILGVLNGGKYPVGFKGLVNEVQAKVLALSGNPDADSIRLQLGALIKHLTQQNLQSILQESGRTISDRDRQLVMEIVGQLEGFNASTTPLPVLKEKLKRLRGDFSRRYQMSVGTIRSYRDMDAEVRSRGGTLLPTGEYYDILYNQGMVTIGADDAGSIVVL